jgi:hypothetical protein
MAFGLQGRSRAILQRDGGRTRTLPLGQAVVLDNLALAEVPGGKDA